MSTTFINSLRSLHFVGLTTCPPSYLFNPHSRTCITIVPFSETWYTAKSFCESKGDRLAVFDTLGSISWVKHMRKTHPGNELKLPSSKLSFLGHDCFKPRATLYKFQHAKT